MKQPDQNVLSYLVKYNLQCVISTECVDSNSNSKFKNQIKKIFIYTRTVMGYKYIYICDSPPLNNRRVNTKTILKLKHTKRPIHTNSFIPYRLTMYI